MQQHTLSGFRTQELDADGLTFFKASTETVNRKGFIVSTKGINLDNFKANPIFQWMHTSSNFETPAMEDVLGRVQKVKKQSGDLIIGVEWAQHERAQLAESLVDGGFLNTVSIGFSFNPDAVGKKKVDGLEWPILNESDLFEVSLVMVPANPEARKMALALLSGEVPHLEEGNPPPDNGADIGELLEGVQNMLLKERLRSIWR